MATGRVRKNLILLLSTITVVLCCLFALGADTLAKESTVEGRVLFLSSYSYSWRTVRMQMEGIEEAMGPEVKVEYEFMNSGTVYDETSMEIFYEAFKYRLENSRPYDVVILGDDVALQFALDHRDELFRDVPLVFEGVSDETLAREAAKEPLITGIIERLSIEDNIKLGLNVNSQAVRVIAILDDTDLGERQRRNFYQCEDAFPELQFLEIDCSQFTTEQLKKELQQISKYSILLYMAMTEDASGKKYTSSAALNMIRENASVPVIGMVDIGIGDGLLGGNVVSMVRSGEIAAQIAMDILSGKDRTSSDEVVDSPNLYYVDQNVLKKYGVSKSSFPANTVWINEKESYFERNRETLVPGVVLLLALLVVMGIVCLDNLRGKKMQKELEEAKTIMESASQHDFLTGLPNRSKFMEDLTQMIAEQKPCTVVMLDIDDFKKINDTYGHTAGDEALKQVASRLKEMTSPILSAYRYAGDEFIMIQQSSQRKIVEKTAYQCRQLFSKPFLLAGEKRKICGSIGLACYPEDTSDLEQLIVFADDAMYQVKKNGKNDFAFYQKTEE